MEYNQENLKRILEQAELTDDNREWLLRYLESADQPALQQLLHEYFEENIDKDSAIENGISNRVLKGIHDKLNVQPPVTRAPVVRLKFIRLAAASVIIGILGLSVYFLLSTRQSPKIPNRQLAAASSVQQVTEVVPGSDGAILTLSDGSRVLLDSSNNGTLKADNGSKIIKVGNQVIYNELNSKNELVYNTMSTPRGRQFQLVLADGSKVWLNAASSIRFPTAFTGNDRKVEVTGELYFEVAKNPSKPFKVVANGTEIEVLGTHFNVDGYDEVVKTTLLEGSVKIKAGTNTGFLKPGQQAQTSTSGEVKTSNAVDVEQVMAWKNGRFAFENVNLETIMNQISRWYDVDVVYQGKIPERSFTADISRNTNLSEFLKVLEESGIHFRIDGKKLLVQP